MLSQKTAEPENWNDIQDTAFLKGYTQRYVDNCFQSPTVDVAVSIKRNKIAFILNINFVS